MKFLKGLIFDLDGVIADTEDIHRQAYNRAFGENGFDLRWSEKDYRDRLIQTAGSKLEGIPAIENHAHPQEFRQSLYHRKREIYLHLLAEVRLPPRPGVVDLIDQARKIGVKLGAASTCAKEGAMALLRHTLGEDILSDFVTIKAGEDATNRKPAPDIYLRAIEGLGLEPEECIAIEDSVHGLQAALAAGLCTVVTPSQYTLGDDFEGSHLVVPDLFIGKISVESLDHLLAGVLGEITTR